MEAARGNVGSCSHADVGNNISESVVLPAFNSIGLFLTDRKRNSPLGRIAEIIECSLTRLKSNQEGRRGLDQGELIMQEVLESLWRSKAGVAHSIYPRRKARVQVRFMSDENLNVWNIPLRSFCLSGRREQMHEYGSSKRQQCFRPLPNIALNIPK